MSAAPASGSAAPKSKGATAESSNNPAKETKPVAALEEDDEFEDFPVEGELISPFTADSESQQGYLLLLLLNGGSLILLSYSDWTQEDTEVQGDSTHLWEESWDDDDTSEDFSAQLKLAFSIMIKETSC